MSKHDKNNKHVIAKRRERVAQLRLRGATVQEIVATLTANGWLNPTTNAPWSVGTIIRDLSVMKKRWLASAARHTDEHKAAQLAEIREARREAWKKIALPEIRQLIKLEIELLGTADQSLMPDTLIVHHDYPSQLLHDAAAQALRNLSQGGEIDVADEFLRTAVLRVQQMQGDAIDE